MISFIRGELAAVEPQKAIVDVGGVGYGVYMSSRRFPCSRRSAMK